MAEVSKSEGGEVVPPQLPIPYVTNYTNKTLTIIPLLLTSLRVWAIAMLEWGSLRFIDHAPISVWVSSALIAGLVLVVLEKREWLNFKNRRYFPISLSVLMTIWIGIVGFAYYLDTPSQASANVAKVTKDNADDDRDAVVRHLVTALNERDQARRDLASTKRDLEAARAQQPQSTPVAPADSAPLSWEGNPNWVTFGGANGGVIPYLDMRGSNPSTGSVQLKEAYLTSATTGEKIQMVADAGLEGKIPISQMNAISAGASITLRAMFDTQMPPTRMPLKEFADHWIRGTFTAEYEGVVFTRSFNLEAQLRNYPELQLGPRVTRKKQQ